jgi:3-deoxy-manno-octulosonate cytidylyltransferase (CMP-KDO synthetase)
LAAIAVIPARFASSRFPGKSIANATGKPLVQHVVERAKAARRLDDVVVATDDRRIVEALRTFDTRCIMTSPAHPSGTDRIAEVAAGLSHTIIVNVQGDEPEIDPATIDQLVDCLEQGGQDMATAATPFPTGADPADPNLVKVAIGLDGQALYFSRSVIPFFRDSTGAGQPTYYLHQGIYAYRRKFLLELASWASTPLELSEKLEQLRVLEHGRGIHVILTERAVHGIDTAEQYDAFVKRYKEVAISPA